MKVYFVGPNKNKSQLFDLKASDVFRFFESNSLEEGSYNVVISLKSKNKSKITYVPIVSQDKNVLIFYADSDRDVVKIKSKLQLSNKKSEQMKLSAAPVGAILGFNLDDRSVLFIKTDKQNPDSGNGVYQITNKKGKIDFSGSEIVSKDAGRLVYVYEINLNLNTKIK